MSRNGFEPDRQERSGAGGRGGHLSAFLPAVIGTGMALFLLFTRGGLEPESPAAFWHTLCDALFVPGVFLTGAGLLVVVSAGGAFDALKFAAGRLFSLFRKEEQRAGDPANYYEYVARQKKKPFHVPAALLGTGIGFLAAAAVSLILYMQALN